jgi:hypothetical protein
LEICKDTAQDRGEVNTLQICQFFPLRKLDKLFKQTKDQYLNTMKQKKTKGKSVSFDYRSVQGLLSVTRPERSKLLHKKRYQCAKLFTS